MHRGWRLWNAIWIACMAAAFVLPSHPDTSPDSQLAALGFLVLTCGWLFRFVQLWGGRALVAWLAAITTLIAVVGGMASVLGADSRRIPGAVLIILILAAWWTVPWMIKW